MKMIIWTFAIFFIIYNPCFSSENTDNEYMHPILSLKVPPLTTEQTIQNFFSESATKLYDLWQRLEAEDKDPYYLDILLSLSKN